MTARFIAILTGVIVTTGIVAVLQRRTGFAPLILFVIPIAVFLRVGGLGAGLITAATGAVIGDFFFVEPTRTITVHTEGIRLLVVLTLVTFVAWVAMRATAYRGHR